MAGVSIFVLLVFIATLCSIVLLVYTIMQHTSDKAYFLIFLTTATFLYSFSYLLELTSPNLEAAFQAVRVQYMGLPFVLPVSYLFVRDIYGKPRFHHLQHLLYFLIPVLSALTMQAYPLLKVYYSNVMYIHNGAFANCRVYPGPLYHIYTAYCYLLFLLILKTVIQHLVRGDGSPRTRRLGWIFLVAYLTPMLASLPYVLSTNEVRYDLTPIANTVSMALLLYATRYHNLLSVVPLARDQVIESMEDAFIVCDGNFHFLDANAAAKRLFPVLRPLMPGDVIPGWEKFKNVTDFSVPVDGETRFFRATQTHIFQDKIKNGMCFVLHDTTENQKLIQTLQIRSDFDPLMDIYTRGTFFERAQFMLHGGASRKHSYSLFMIDLDRFKAVNDTYGHPAGDFVLKTVAAAIKAASREGDLIGRYGGEEIILLLEDLSREDAVSSAERLRTTIEHTPITYQTHTILTTVSIGAAFSPAGGYSLEDMIRQADEALYKAKNNGRNQTVIL